MFRKHRDISFIRNPRECSYYTFMVYLNDNFKGGSTKFDNYEILPQQGKCLLFYHPIEHEGSVIENGVKYILRSDIMFRFSKNGK